MSRPLRPRLLFCSLLGASLLAGCTSYRGPSGQAVSMDGAPVAYSGGTGAFSRADAVDTGIFVPDGRGGMLWVPGNPRTAPNADYVEAQELRLKVRELAAQLLEVPSNQAIFGLVALPTSFVDLNNFTETSPFGRYMAEAMFYEFNQRGVPVREYRLNGKIRMVEADGEFALTRNLPPLAVRKSWAAVLVGTYLKDANGIFVNARLVRPTDGLVLRTAQLVLGANPMLARLTAKPPKPPFTSGTLRIRSENTPTRSRNGVSRTSQPRRSIRPADPRAATDLTPAQPQTLPGTAQIQAAHAAQVLSARPAAQANVSAVVRSAKNGNRPSGQEMYSGRAEAISRTASETAPPMPGPPKNT